MSSDIINNTMKEYSNKEIGPIVFSYVSWIINEALKKGIERLYFLARDGYILYIAASEICKKHKIDIDLRYLYCSRYALRMPTYHFIGEEAFETLFGAGMHPTPSSVIMRAGLSENETNEILDKINVFDKHEILTWETYDSFIEKLRSCSEFIEIVSVKSKECYQNAINYFKSENLFGKEYVAIVDSGWAGTMQRSLRQLLRNEGYKGKFIGFYFGMFSPPKSSDDGEYHTFYFNYKKDFKKKLFFNNSVFECMLSANHGMTTGYIQKNEKVIPITEPAPDNDMLNLINSQLEGITDYIKEHSEHFTVGHFDKKRAQKICYSHLRKTMIFPKRRYAELYSRFTFCDDVKEQFRIPLADKNGYDELKAYLIIPKILRKLFHKKYLETKLYWPCGTASLCFGFFKKHLYIFNILSVRAIQSLSEARRKRKETDN